MKKKDHSQKIPLNLAIMWIFFSVLLVSGSAFLSLLYFQYVTKLRANDDKYQIIAIVQATAEPEPLKTVYLAELLGLSVDNPTNIHCFNLVAATRKLLTSPLIKEATIEKIKPGTLYIEYSMRKPIAFLADYSNTVIDEEGVPFPFKPFFTPKRLPEIYLGLAEPSDQGECKWRGWGVPLDEEKFNLALTILNLVKQNCSATDLILRIDVSKAYAASYGQRQIVLTLEERVEKEKNGNIVLFLFPRILRFSTKNYVNEFAHYQVLSKHLQNHDFFEDKGEVVVKADPLIIDLRIPQLAFIAK